MGNDTKSLNTILGLTIVGCAVVGIVSLLAAAFPIFGGDPFGAGMLLAASALAFGSLARALLGR